MAQCKINKITAICDKWNCKEIKLEDAMKEIQKVIGLKESEMPPCTCNKKQEQKPKEKAACPLPKEKVASQISKEKPKGKASCLCPPSKNKEKIVPEKESCSSCHSPGPSTINPFFNYLKELRQTTCFNQTVVDVAKEAACKWSIMTDCDRAPYIMEAYHVSKKKEVEKMKRENSSTSCGCPSKVKKLD